MEWARFRKIRTRAFLENMIRRKDFAVHVNWILAQFLLESTFQYEALLKNSVSSRSASTPLSNHVNGMSPQYSEFIKTM